MLEFRLSREIEPNAEEKINFLKENWTLKLTFHRLNI